MEVRSRYLAAILAAVIIGSSLSVLPAASATTWYPGENIKQGDYYRYNVCWIDWHNCAPLEIDFWVKNQTSDGTGWNLEMVAIDGSIIQKGIVTIGTTTPDPTYSDSNIADYSNVYKNTIAWLDAFSSKDNQQTLGSPSWGRTGSVGGQSVGSMGQQTITVKAGTYQTWILGWHKDVDNTIWIAPSLSFPVKAIVFTDVTSGTPPPDYNMELLENGNSATEPAFMNVQSTALAGANPNCPIPDEQNDATSGSQSTDSGSMIIAYRYSPAVPNQGCPVEWRIAFEKTFDQSQKYSAVQYDIFQTDDQGNQISSKAQDLGRSALNAPVGEDDIMVIMHGSPPTAHFVIAAFGIGADGTTPDTSLAGLIKIDISIKPPVAGSTAQPTTPTVPTPTTPATPATPAPAQQTVIPSWVKNNAKWWSQGQIGDDQFVKGIQYMIQNGIIQIPPAQQGAGNATQQIPAWIKNTAGWWAGGQIPDDQFVKGLQYMITSGIITLKS